MKVKQSDDKSYGQAGEQAAAVQPCDRGGEAVVSCGVLKERFSRHVGMPDHATTPKCSRDTAGLAVGSGGWCRRGPMKTMQEVALVHLLCRASWLFLRGAHDCSGHSERTDATMMQGTIANDIPNVTCMQR